MKGEILIESLAIWAIAVLFAIGVGWTMLSAVEWAAALVLLLAVLMATTRATGPRGFPSVGRRLAQWWAVGSGWVFLVWFLSWGPLAPRGLLSLFMMVGLATGLLMMGALGSLASLLLAVMSNRRTATVIMVGVEALMVLFTGLRLERFYLLAQGGAILAPWWERMTSLEALAWLLGRAWPIGVAAVGVSLLALSVRVFVQRPGARLDF